MASSFAGSLRRRPVRRLVGLLLLPGLALRLLMPAGFMPGGAGDGGHLIQMCHGAGPVPMATHGPPDGSTPPSQRTHHEAPCIFAAAGSVAPPFAAIAVVAPAVAADNLPPAPCSSFEQRTSVRAHRARAPPDLRLAA